MTLTRQQAIDRLTNNINSAKADIIKKQTILDSIGNTNDYLVMAKKSRLIENIKVGLTLLIKRYQDNLDDPHLFKIYCENN